MKSSFVIGKIAGIEIGVHYSWPFAFLIITGFLGLSVFPSSYPQWATVTHWVMAAVAAIGLFASVLAHELAHSFVALAKGLQVRSITLFIFGGASNLGADTERPGDEFQVSIAGPLMSLLIGGLAMLAWRSMAPDSSREAQPVHALLFYLGWMNVGVGLFNLLPGLPLDGGRVLRSIVWQATGNMDRATTIASRAGQVVGWLIVAYGVYMMISRGSILSGLWLALIGWFLAGSASSAMRQTRRRRPVAGHKSGASGDSGVLVRQVMRANPVVVGPDLPVHDLVYECFLRLNCTAAPVLDSSGLVGIVTEPAAQMAGESAWRGLAVRQIMDPNPVIAKPDDPAAAALERMVASGATHAVVADGARVVGTVELADLSSAAGPARDLRSRAWRR